MANEDRSVVDPPPRGPSASPRIWTGLGILLAVGLLLAVFVTRQGDEVPTPTTNKALGSAVHAQPTTTIDEQDELVNRLEEILARREQAYRERSTRTLQEIYTVDCPCLESDSNAIHELKREGYVWVGGETSIKVRRTERVSARLWTIIADFTSAPLRIETESGRLTSAFRAPSQLEVMPAGSNDKLVVACRCESGPGSCQEAR
jgi:hypothetical protein